MFAPLRRGAFLLAFVTLILPPSLSGQAGAPGPRGTEFWGGYSAWSGDDVEGFDPAWQVGVSLLRGASGSFGVGIEGMAGRFDASADDTGWEFGVNALFRWALGPRDRTHPFLQGRVGWHRLSAEVTGLKLRQDGFSIGPEIGLVIPVTQRSGIVLAAGGSWQLYGTGTLFATPDGGPGLGNNEGSAFRFGGRIGWLLGGNRKGR